MQDYRDLHHMGWIEQVPPSQWSWVQKEYGLPVDPDTLGQVPPTVSNLITTQLCLAVQRSPQTQVITVLLLKHRLEPLRVHLLAHLLMMCQLLLLLLLLLQLMPLLPLLLLLLLLPLLLLQG